MFKSVVACSLTILVSAGLLLAHGDATHIMGTVTSVQGNHVMVKTQDGKTEMVMMEKTTKYMIGTKAAKAADMTVGKRVVIDAKMDEKMKMYTAMEVKIGVSTPAAPDSKAKAAVPANTHADHK